MKKQIVLFVATFTVGAIAALALRTATHHPYAGHTGHPPAAPTSTNTFNTICPICGMPVDPTLPTAQYEGKTIGFGCKTCPQKFAENSDDYGPAALRNEEAK